jgi:hypothetical protein
MIEGGGLYGNGVNAATRLDSLAEPGGDRHLRLQGDFGEMSSPPASVIVPLLPMS